MGSQSYTYSVPLFSLPGRHGLDLNLSLIYNSLLWQQGGLGVGFNFDSSYQTFGGTPSYGFRLDFGALVWFTGFAGDTSGMLVDATGAKHFLIDASGTGFGNTFKTNDSSYITVQHHAGTGGTDPASDVVTYKSGVQVFYQFAISNGNITVTQPVKIEDASGNFITIAYTGGWQFAPPSISTITDTVGRKIKFFYTTIDTAGDLRLDCVTDGATCTSAGAHTFTFSWNHNYILSYNFSQIDGTIPPLQGSQYPYTVLSGVTRPDGTQVKFNYGDWLIVNDIQELSSNGTLRYETSYNFPLASDGQLNAPPTYTQQTVTTLDKDGNSQQSIWSYQTTETSAFSGQKFVSCFAVTDPAGTIHMTTFSTGGSVFDGIPIQRITATGSTSPCTDAPSTILKTVTTQWTSDLDGSGNPTGINPRSQSTTTVLSDGVTQAQTQTTGYDSHGNPTDIQQFDFGSGQPGPLLREVTATYATNVGNIFNLPTDIQVKDGAGKVLAHETREYDNYGTTQLKTVAVAPPGFDSANFGTATTPPRGNLTGSTVLADAAAGTGAITSTFTYDVFGNRLTSQSGCCTQGSAVYSAVTQYAYPDSVSTGPSASQLTTNLTYYMSNGRVATSTDPNGLVSSLNYDIDNRPANTTSADGVTATYAYDDAAENPTGSVSTSANSLVIKTIEDFLGRPLLREMLNGSTLLSTTAHVNDGLGRPTQISNPYGPGETTAYTNYVYDALGRKTSVTRPAISTSPQNSSQIEYNPATFQDAAGATHSGTSVQSTDPANHQRKEYRDGLGRLVRVEEPGGGSPATISSGSITINGALQSWTGSAQSATKGRAELTFSGTLKSKSNCAPSGQTCTDSGLISITVARTTKTAAYSSSTGTDSGQTVHALANAFHSDTQSPVDAIYYGADEFGNIVMDLVARTTGAATNYPLSISITSNDPPDFSPPSFQVSAGSSLIGGQDASSGGTIYDSGVVYMSVGTFTASAPYSHGGNSTAEMIASALVASGPTGLNRSGSPVTATASGSTLTMTYKSAGATGNVFVNVTSSSANPDNPSFTSPGASLTGGADAVNPDLSTPAITFYSYDAQGNLLQVMQGEQTRTFEYDSLGRMTSATIPETGYRKTSITYTDFGAPSQVVDPRLVSGTSSHLTATFTYDALNRIKTLTYNDGTPGITYTYNPPQSANNTGGRLASVANSVATELYRYDLMGRPVLCTKTIAGQDYKIAYAYHPDGTRASITYPSGRLVTFKEDSIGRLSEIDNNSSSLLSIGSYNAAGETLGETYGNGLQGAYTYNSQLQLASLKYSTVASTILDLTYGYGGVEDNGQIRSIIDGVVGSRDTNYVYDALGRLQSAQTSDLTSPNTWRLEFAYDRYGNRLSQTPTGGTASIPLNQILIDPTTNHIISGGYSYDDAGNTIGDGLFRYVINGANQMTSVTPVGSSTATATFSYDATGLRVVKNNTIYIYSGRSVIAEYASGAAANLPTTEHIYRGALRLATISSGAITYHYADHLSVRADADSTGHVVRNYGSYPFGETWYETGNADKWKFTNYENDSESGLNYAGARFHSPRTGRFITLDPLSGRRSNPQSLNRYAYVHNDPINSIDPTGMEDMEEDDPPDGPPCWETFVGCEGEGSHGDGCCDSSTGDPNNLPDAPTPNDNSMFPNMPPNMQQIFDAPPQSADPGPISIDFSFNANVEVHEGSRSSDAFEPGSLAYDVFQGSASTWSAASGTVNDMFWGYTAVYGGLGAIAAAPTVAAYGTGLYYQGVMWWGLYGSGALILGSYRDYVTEAENTGAVAFNVPNLWYKAMGNDAVIANEMVLDGAIRNGYTIYFSNPPANAQFTSGLWYEAWYLSEKLGIDAFHGGPIVTWTPR
jgi:RHS repeat-associated protein